MAGLIYILRNDDHPINVYKIGRTDRPIQERINELSGGCLTKYKEIVSWHVDNNKAIESKIHNILDSYKLKNLHVREFFNIQIDIAIDFIEKILKNENIINNNSKILETDSVLEKYPIIKDQNNELWCYKNNYWNNIDREKICNSTNEIFSQLKIKKVSWNKSLKNSELVFKNFILDTKTKTIKNHSFDNYINKIIAYDYKENTKVELWLKTLNEWFKNSNKILFLQEFFGFVLSFNYEWRKILILQGPFNCGKYTIIKILTKIVGQNNVYPIFNKNLLNFKYLKIIENSIFTNVHVITPSELKIKNQGFNKLIDQSFSKFIFNIESNNKNYDVKFINTRLQTIIFDGITTVKNYNCNYKLYDQLMLEIEGIVKWSVDGFERLLKNNGEFTKID